MSNLQTGKNLLVAYKAETTFNTPPSTGSAYQFRLNAGGGLKLARATINSNEIRSDGKMAMGRLGSKSVTGSYIGDVSVGTFDPLFEAVMRSTWVAAVSITQSTMTSVTATAGPPSTIVAAAGSWITQGVRVGDVVRLNATGGPAGNNSRNLRVTAVTATVLTVAETLTLDATPRTTFTLTILKKLIQPTTPVRRSFTFEEYDADIDASEQATGCRISSMKITGQPDGMATVEFGIVGADLNPLTGGSSPYYVAPTLTTSIGLVFTDATLRLAGADILSLTAFELTYDLTAKGQPVVGSMVTPDIFENNAQVSGSLSALRSDLSSLTKFTSETEMELHVLLVEPESEPKDCISVFVPRIKLTGVDKSPGSDGALIETLPFMVGTKGAGVSGYDDSMLTICTSAS